MSANKNTDQLIEWLKGKDVRESILDKLREEEYDGTSFCLATDEELADLGSPKLKRGPLTKLIRFRDELKSGVRSKDATEEEKVPTPSVPEPQPTPAPVVSTESNHSRPRIPSNQAGKNSPWYKEIQQNLTAISNAIRLAPSALDALNLKFMEKKWISPGDHPTAQQIGTMALGRIEIDANQFWVFIDILKDTAGTDILAGTLESNVTPAAGNGSLSECSGTGPGRASTSSESSAINTSHPILKRRPSMQLINLIKYKDGSEEKSLRLIQEVAPHWKAVARALGNTPATISIIAKSHPQDPMEAAHQVLSQWMGRDPEHSWAKLITVLQEASEELKVVASDLHFALTHQM